MTKPYPDCVTLYMLLDLINYIEEGIGNIIKNMVIFKPYTKRYLQVAVYEFNTQTLNLNEADFPNTKQYKKYGPIELWDTSLITDMSYLFSGFKFTYINITDWDISNVKTIEGMFTNSYLRNKPFNEWKIRPETNTNKFVYNTNTYYGKCGYFISKSTISKSKFDIVTFVYG